MPVSLGNGARSWERCAREHWASAGHLSALSIEAVLGGREHLKGPASSGGPAAGEDGAACQEGDGVTVLVGSRRGFISF